jgi:hypothetical protein
MKQHNTFEIEELYDKQVSDLTRRTVRGKNTKMRMRQTDLEDFRNGTFAHQSLKRKAHRNTFAKRAPEDYGYDEESEEWKNTYRESM